MTYYFNIWHSKYKFNVKSNNNLSKAKVINYSVFLYLGYIKFKVQTVFTALIMLIIILVHAQNAKTIPHLAK